MNPPHESRPLRVSVYCPDRHIQYDGTTPDRSGVGGGVTVRVRTARALARLGHEVTLVCNCPVSRDIGDVRYRRLEETARIEADIVILNSSAGAPDLRPAAALPITARLKIVRVDGTLPPTGLQDIPYDYVYAPSNFIRRVARDEWGIPPAKLAVFHHGVDAGLFKPRRWPWKKHDPFRLVYAGHPDKGLQPAVGVLGILRSHDARYQLHVYGGDGLYGKRDQPIELSPSVVYHGTIGQRRLVTELRKSNVALGLQARQEPFGLVVVEAMAAGCLVIVSPVGAYPEIVQHGSNGFLVGGDHMDPSTWQTAADLIHTLASNPTLADLVRGRARVTPVTWTRVVQAWEEHWTWALSERASNERTSRRIRNCPECGGDRLALADGYHCTRCGAYERGL